jgi:hypothetical protein
MGRKKEEKREEGAHLAEILLNFKKIQIWSKRWWWCAKMGSTSDRNHSTSF